MSEEKSSGTPASKKAEKTNIHKDTTQKNAEQFLAANRSGQAVYFNGINRLEQDGSITFQALPIIKNAVNGHAIKNTNQLLLQNSFNKIGILNEKYDISEVLTKEQIEKCGAGYRKDEKGNIKSRSFLITIPKSKNQDGTYNQDTFEYYPVSAVADKGAVALESLMQQRPKKIAALRARLDKLEKSNAPDAEKEKILTTIAYEHKKNLDYYSVHPVVENGIEVPSPEQIHYEEYVTEKEIPAYKKLIGEKNTPSLEQQKGAAVNEIKQNKEYRKSQLSELVIDATNTHSATDYLGKYLAACELGATFKTDKESQLAVQNEINASLEKAFTEKDYNQAFILGKNAGERCTEVMSSFRKQSFEQQRGQSKDRAVIQERPEQDIEMTLG